MLDYLHNHPEFRKLILAVERDKRIERSLVEKDYWIMYVLHGLQQKRFVFELKGGTSLSKGYDIVHRFSEKLRKRYEQEYKKPNALYYQGQPSFDEILRTLLKNLDKL